MKAKALLPTVVAVVLMLGSLTALSCRLPADGSADPLFYAQCDAAWRDVVMTTQTICQVGDVLTSLAMMMTTQDTGVTPATLDDYLDVNSGYSMDNIFWNAIENHPTTDFTFIASGIPFAISTLKTQLDNGYFVVLHVNSGTHWVLVFDYDGDGTQFADFILHDPGSGTGGNQRLAASDNPTQMFTYHPDR